MRSIILLGLALALTAACGETLLPKASFPNEVDTVSIYALSGTPVAAPSAYSMELRQAVRIDQSGGAFDFAFDIDSAGRAVLLPTGALKLGRQSGILLTTTPFDSIRVAPGGNYQRDSAVVVDSNSVAIVHSRSLRCPTIGLSAVLYGKLHVLAIDTTSAPGGRRIDLRILTDVNCGYRGLQEGLPNR
ncbi:MAG TPA: hypothetical protein VGQ48_08345 [Gemmatimonadales bacterium]|jgi:hypothetical protein|nr:hypothetical protein [Gemmatimonadales bacterium]